jgi:Zn-dependent protease
MDLHPEPINIAFFALYWVVFVYSIVLHEVAHGYSSYLLGDPTAWKAGRLTLNPVHHVHPIYSVVMPIVFFLGSGVPFGGAKPVPVNPVHYRNLRWGSLTSAAAGPLANVGLAILFATLFVAYRAMAGGEPTLTTRFLATCMMLNVFLAAFNLLPIPPLDGSHVLGSLLPRELRDSWGKFQALGWIPIIVLVIVDNRVWPVISKPLFYAGQAVLALLGATYGWGDATQPIYLLKGGG